MKEAPEIRMNPFTYLNQSIQDPIGLRTKLFEKYGDIAWKKTHGARTYYFRHPLYVEYILDKHQDKYFNRHPLLVQTFSPFLGLDSLITTNKLESWYKDRLIAKISFDEKTYFKEYATTIVSLCQETFEKWEQKYRFPQLFNVEEELDKLLVNIVTHTFLVKFDVLNIEEFTKVVPSTVELIKANLKSAINPFWYFSSSRRQYDAVVQYVKDTTYAIIKDRLEQRKQWDDMLSYFMHEYRYLNEKDLIDYMSQHMATFLVVGYFTTVSLLHWLTVLLSTHPTVRHEICQELERVLGGRPPQYEDLNALPYLSAVIKETLRFRPSNYSLMRQAVEEDEMNGYYIPKGAGIIISIPHLHRHPEFWENPDGYDPMRFIDNPLGQNNRFAFIPFGAGKRSCIASAFAKTEAMLITAMLLQRFRIDLPPNTEVKPFTTTLLTNRPDTKWMWIRKR